MPVTGVIKADSARAETVRPFCADASNLSTAGTSDHPEAHRPCCDAVSREAELTEQLALREVEIASHEAALAAAFENGKAAGLREAEAEFDESRQASLAALVEGLAAAREQLAEAFRSFDTAALSLAVEMVDKLVGDPSTYRDMLVQAIGSRLRALEETAILSVAVSRLDFPDTSEIALLPVAPDKVLAREDLEEGECKIDLHLGGEELSLLGQWEDLKDRLSDGVLSPVTS